MPTAASPHRFYADHVEQQLFVSAPAGISGACDGHHGPEKYSMADALHRMPTLDLHCHLNGSISAPLLRHLEGLLHGTSSLDTPSLVAAAAAAVPTMTQTPKQRMEQCFTVFDTIYRVMTNITFTRLAVQDMVFCSAEENMLLLEIRTSLRDGMQQSMRDGRAATKQGYVEAIVETVEHLLRGGLIDLATGEVLSLEASQATLAALSHPSERNAETDAWWCCYDAIYGYRSSNGKKFRVPSGAAVAAGDGPELPPLRRHRQYFVDQIYRIMTTKMHVRLLLSINRGGTVKAAEEAASLTTQTQQRQVYHFHQWLASANLDEPLDHRKGGGAVNLLLRRRERLLLEKLRCTCWVTGIDFSGSCYKGHYSTFEPSLAAAREGCCGGSEAGPEWPIGGASPPHLRRLRTRASVTLHGGEKEDVEELSRMVAFGGDRWGHLVFTDRDNLQRILAAQQGIELCLTSNLLTGGHAAVQDHHVGDLMALWWSMQQRGGDAAGPPSMAGVLSCGSGGAVALVEDTYTVTEAARLQHRYARLRAPTTATAAVKAGALPNISFNTDDRGVFGTALWEELLLAAQHPSIGGLDDSHGTSPASAEQRRRAVQTLWKLERLMLIQVFEIPFSVLLLTCIACTTFETDSHEGARDRHQQLHCSPSIAAVFGEAEIGGGTTHDKADTRDEIVDPSCPFYHWASRFMGLGTGRPGEDEAASPSPFWHDWESFVTVYNATMEEKEGLPSSDSPAALLSQWEWRWLTECFDSYY